MKEPYAEGHPYLAGETVTTGGFVCAECGHLHRVEGTVTNLPVCPECQNDTWEGS